MRRVRFRIKVGISKNLFSVKRISSKCIVSRSNFLSLDIKLKHSLYCFRTDIRIFIEQIFVPTMWIYWWSCYDNWNGSKFIC